MVSGERELRMGSDLAMCPPTFTPWVCKCGHLKDQHGKKGCRDITYESEYARCPTCKRTNFGSKEIVKKIVCKCKKYVHESM